MNQDMFTDLAIKITSELAALNANMKNVLDKLADHEKRIDDLEKGKNSSWKDDLLKWLARGLVASVLVIGSLTGAAGLIKSVFGL